MIPIASPYINKLEKSFVLDAMNSTWISSKGRYINEFEKKIAGFSCKKYGVAVSNGTTALHLALLALDIKKDDEVIVPDLTFVATANAVIYTGATPVFVDINYDDWNICPEYIEKAITSKTRAIIPVHIYGNPCCMDKIMKIAKKYNLYVIEDCAEAHGALYKNRKAGSFGHINCFSFYGNKIITTGEGGMCITNNKKLYEKMRILRDHGMDPKKRYWYNIVGYNYRLTNLQAAFGMAQFMKINKIIQKKREIALWYEQGFNFLKMQKVIQLHKEKENTRSVFWMYSILILKKFGLKRDQVINSLYQKGIEIRPFFTALHLMPPYKKYIKKGQLFPVSENIGKTGINLPSSPDLNKKIIFKICNEIKSLYLITNKSKKG